MRRFFSIALTVASLIPAGLAVTATQPTTEVNRTAVVVTAKADRTDPAEDSPRFDCRKHGNRTCGVRIDPTPNDGKNNTVRINVVFNKRGQAVDAYPFGARR